MPLKITSFIWYGEVIEKLVENMVFGSMM